jgi:hypothetical protein
MEEVLRKKAEQDEMMALMQKSLVRGMWRSMAIAKMPFHYRIISIPVFFFVFGTSYLASRFGWMWAWAVWAVQSAPYHWYQWSYHNLTPIRCAVTVWTGTLWYTLRRWQRYRWALLRGRTPYSSCMLCDRDAEWCPVEEGGPPPFSLFCEPCCDEFLEDVDGEEKVHSGKRVTAPISLLRQLRENRSPLAIWRDSWNSCNAYRLSMEKEKDGE